MTVRVQFFAQLRDVSGTPELQIELDEHSSIGDLLDRIYQQKPALRVHDQSTLIGVGVEFVGRDYIVRPGDTIAVMPPVQGG
jgi:molybdopterin converting factor small subunit